MSLFSDLVGTAVWVALLLALALGLYGCMEAMKRRRERLIARQIVARGGRVLEMSRDLRSRDWSNRYIYDVVVVEADGKQHVVQCRANFFAVRWL